MALERAFWAHQEHLTHKSREELDEAIKQAKEQYDDETVEAFLAKIAEAIRKHNQRLTRPT